MRCLLIFLCLVLCGCNLVRGIGQDTAAVGRTLTKISGTQGDQHSQPAEDPLPAAEQPYDQTYVQPFEDQSYVEPDARTSISNFLDELRVVAAVILTAS